MQPDTIDDEDGVDLNIEIRAKDGITDRIIIQVAVVLTLIMIELMVIMMHRYQW